MMSVGISFALALLLIVVATVNAFSPLAQLPPPIRVVSVGRATAAKNIRVTTDASSDFGTAMPEAPASPYDELGIQEENLALGIDPKDVLAYVGT